MIDVKVSASFILQGSVLPAEHPCSKKGKEEKKKKKKRNESPNDKKDEILYNTEIIKLNVKKGKQETIVINVRASKPATQVIHLCKDAYENMISANEVPCGCKANEWKKLSNNKRLKWHLERIAEQLNGTLQEFSVLED